PAPAAESPDRTAAVAEAARTFTPLFVLTVAVVAFLAVQGRLDRREAKLASAPVDPDVLEFR
ncbi:MAG: hypothetical protein ACRDY4_03185, partial [Acidimicrobiia bacterium]